MAALSVLSVAATHAEFISGNDLYERLIDPARITSATFYVMGVHDAMAGINHCTPPNVKSGQVTDMTLDVLRKAPELRHNSADIFVRVALNSAFPCKKGKESLSL